MDIPDKRSRELSGMEGADCGSKKSCWLLAVGCWPGGHRGLCGTPIPPIGQSPDKRSSELSGMDGAEGCSHSVPVLEGCFSLAAERLWRDW